MADFFADAAKGALGGIAGGPIGMAAGAASAVVSDLADSVGLTQWLFGPNAAPVQAAVASAVQSVVGTADPATALASDPAAALALRGKLAEIAAGCARDARAADLAQMQAALADVAGARAQTAALAAAHSPVQYAAPVVSVIVLAAFGGLALAVIEHGVPAGSETVVNMLLGTLAAMATSVVSYWVGSSAGSAQKSAQLAKLSGGAG